MVLISFTEVCLYKILSRVVLKVIPIQLFEYNYWFVIFVLSSKCLCYIHLDNINGIFMKFIFGRYKNKDFRD